MANLIFLPIAEDIRDATYRVYDGACGTGGMLTVAEETLNQLAQEHGKEVSIHLFGQEVQPETYAISKADLLLKGEGQAAENIKYGSTLSSDAFPVHGVRLHALQPALRQELEDRPRPHGRQGKIRRPAIHRPAPGRASSPSSPAPATASSCSW